MLRERLIRLAQAHPGLRPHLLPLLREGGTKYDSIPRTHPKGSSFMAYEDPSMLGALKIDRQNGTLLEVVDQEERFTAYGPQPYVTHLLLEDPDGNQVWVPPWALMRGVTPDRREDVEAIARKLNSVFRKFNLKRSTELTRYERTWTREYHQPIPPDDIEKIKKALNQLSWVRRVRDGVYEIQWPTDHNQEKDFDLVVERDISLRPRRHRF